MRSIAVAVLSAVLIGVFYASASAFDVGGAVGGAAKDAAKAGGRKVVESEINKNLKEKDCSFKPKSTELNCDLDDILSTIKAQKTIAEKAGLANDVDIYINIGRGNDKKNPNLGSDRMSLVREKLIKKISWWDWYDRMKDGDQLELSVKVE